VHVKIRSKIDRSHFSEIIYYGSSQRVSESERERMHNLLGPKRFVSHLRLRVDMKCAARAEYVCERAGLQRNF
jgi:hypothetical protein